MKLTKIELEPTPNNYVLATVYVNHYWDVDSYLFELDSVRVDNVERPDLYAAAETWMEKDSKYLEERADEEYWHGVDAV